IVAILQDQRVAQRPVRTNQPETSVGAANISYQPDRVSGLHQYSLSISANVLTNVRVKPLPWRVSSGHTPARCDASVARETAFAERPALPPIAGATFPVRSAAARTGAANIAASCPRREAGYSSPRWSPSVKRRGDVA